VFVVHVLTYLNHDEVEKDVSIVVPDKDIVEVKSGDTLNKIAKAHLSNVAEPLSLTAIKSPGWINGFTPGLNAYNSSNDSSVYATPYSSETETAPLSYNSAETASYVASPSYVTSNNYNNWLSNVAEPLSLTAIKSPGWISGFTPGLNAYNSSNVR
jgi:hypothetical protein